jgi:hypothetical protein
MAATVALAGAFVLAGCGGGSSGDRQVEERPFEMTTADVGLDWGITKFQEEPCSGNEMAGGEISGTADFAGIGTLSVEMSSAWDIGNLLDDAEKGYEPVSDAAPQDRPAAPVLGQDDYPYAFNFDPFTQQCAVPVVSATGDVLFTAPDGDELYGLVIGGETYRLDFVMEGDGIETFAIVEFAGGTGRFSDATGSFVVHTIFRMDFNIGEFVLDLAEVLPGGTIRY